MRTGYGGVVYLEIIGEAAAEKIWAGLELDFPSRGGAGVNYEFGHCSFFRVTNIFIRMALPMSIEIRCAFGMKRGGINFRQRFGVGLPGLAAFRTSARFAFEKDKAGRGYGLPR